MPVPLLRTLSLALGLCAATLGHAETWPGAEWAQGDKPSGAALDAFEAYAFPTRDDAQRKGVRTDAVVVIRDGELIYERYAGPTRAETPHLTWSVSKSLLAATLGVAYGEGRFKLDDPVARHYPAFAGHGAVQMNHLLHWASGLAWQEDYEYAPLKSSVVAMLYTRGRGDMAAFAAAHPLDAVPGKRFRYSSGDTNVLSAALRGMVGDAYRTTPGPRCSTPGHPLGGVETDAAGTFVGSSYAYMSARDLARVGLLMQRDGRWGDRQLLPKEWVAFNRKPFAEFHTDPKAPVTPCPAATGGSTRWSRAVPSPGPTPRKTPSPPSATGARRSTCCRRRSW